MQTCVIVYICYVKLQKKPLYLFGSDFVICDLKTDLNLITWFSIYIFGFLVLKKNKSKQKKNERNWILFSFGSVLPTPTVMLDGINYIFKWILIFPIRWLLKFILFYLIIKRIILLIASGKKIDKPMDKYFFMNNFNKYMCSSNKIQTIYQKLHNATTMT